MSHPAENNDPKNLKNKAPKKQSTKKNRFATLGLPISCHVSNNVVCPIPPGIITPMAFNPNKTVPHRMQMPRIAANNYTYSEYNYMYQRVRDSISILFIGEYHDDTLICESVFYSLFICLFWNNCN